MCVRCGIGVGRYFFFSLSLLAGTPGDMETGCIIHARSHTHTRVEFKAISMTDLSGLWCIQQIRAMYMV